MPPRHFRHTYLLVAAGGYPLAVLLGAPRPARLPAGALVYDLGRLDAGDHGRLAGALGALRELPYLAEGAPAALLVGGAPVMAGEERGKGLGRLLDLLRT